METTETGQAIAILDSGIQSKHPFLSGKIVGEAYFSHNDGSSRSLCPNGASVQIGKGAAEATTASCINRSENYAPMAATLLV